MKRMNWISGFILLVISLVEGTNTGRIREHKVHNIVLYPDKQSWCKTTPVKQVVTESGYDHRVVENNVCVGTCFSYSVPQTSDITLQPYCDSCQPSETEWYHITLKKLPNAEEDLDLSEPLPETFQKKMQIINNCTCLSCIEQILSNHKYTRLNGADGVQCSTKINTTELPATYYTQIKKNEENPVTKTTESYYKTLSLTLETTEDETLVPPTMSSISSASVLQTLHASATGIVALPETLYNVTTDDDNQTLSFDYKTSENANQTKNKRFNVSETMIEFLKSIQNSSADFKHFDQANLKELLLIIEGDDNKLTDRNLLDFVNYVNVYNNADLELDLTRLRHILIQFIKETQLKIRHRHFGLSKMTNVDGGDDKNSTNVDERHSHVVNHNAIDTSDAKKELHYKVGDTILISKDGESHGSSDNANVVPEYLVAGPHGSLVVSSETYPELR